MNLILSNEDNNFANHVNEINELLNKYIELLDEANKDFVQNNIAINTFTSYHSTKLLLTTFGMDLGENLVKSFVFSKFICILHIIKICRYYIIIKNNM